MVKKNRFLLIFLVTFSFFLISVTGDNIIYSNLVKVSLSAQSEERELLATVESVDDGEAYILKSFSTEDDIPIQKVGQKLYSGDIFKVTKEGISIKCYSNRQPYLLELGISSLFDYCPKIVLDNCDFIDCYRNVENDPIVFFPIPESTLLALKPSFQWKNISDVESYTVVLRDNADNIMWIEESQTSTLDYPKHEDELTEGKKYRLEIIANRTENSEILIKTWFRVISEEQKLELENRIEELAQLDEISRVRSLVNLYKDHNLKSEIFEELEKLIALEPKEAAIYRFIGDSYFSRDLEKAKENYGRAFDLAKVRNNLSEQALLYLRLGQIYLEEESNFYSTEKAKEKYIQAKELYQVLENEESINEINELIKKNF